MACNECHVTTCYIHEYCACARANIMVDIQRAPYRRLVLTIYICPKGFLDFKTSLGIREDFNLESLLASNAIHTTSLCMHTQDFCLNLKLLVVLSWMLKDTERTTIGSYGVNGIATAWCHL